MLRQNQEVDSRKPALKLRLLFSAAIALLVGALPSAHAADSSLPRSTPEAEGMSSQAIVDFVEAVDKSIDTLDSFMIVRHGKVIAEGWWKPNSADKPHILNSVSKSFNSTAVGLAIEKHKLKLNDPVLKFFPGDVSSRSIRQSQSNDCARSADHVERTRCRAQGRRRWSLR